MQADNDFVEKYERLAYYIALRFNTVKLKTQCMDWEDLRQLSLVYLLEAEKVYDESKGVPFESFASIYIYNKFCNYFEHLNTQKQEHVRADLSSLTEDGKDGLDSIIPGESAGEDSLSYRMLRLDIEMQLQKIRKKRKQQSIQTGITIVEQILLGKGASEIMKDMNLKRNAYNYCLAMVRKELRL